MGSVLFDKLEIIRALYDFTLLRHKFNQEELFDVEMYVKRLSRSLRGRSVAPGLDIRFHDNAASVHNHDNAASVHDQVSGTSSLVAADVTASLASHEEPSTSSISNHNVPAGRPIEQTTDGSFKRQRSNYSEMEKQKVVKFALENTQAAAARKYSVPKSLVCRWVQKLADSTAIEIAIPKPSRSSPPKEMSVTMVQKQPSALAQHKSANLAKDDDNARSLYVYDSRLNDQIAFSSSSPSSSSSSKAIVDAVSHRKMAAPSVHRRHQSVRLTLKPDKVVKSKLVFSTDSSSSSSETSDSFSYSDGSSVVIVAPSQFSSKKKRMAGKSKRKSLGEIYSGRGDGRARAKKHHDLKMKSSRSTQQKRNISYFEDLSSSDGESSDRYASKRYRRNEESEKDSSARVGTSSSSDDSSEPIILRTAKKKADAKSDYINRSSSSDSSSESVLISRAKPRARIITSDSESLPSKAHDECHPSSSVELTDYY